MGKADAVNRTSRAVERSPEERDRLRAIRERFQKERPGPDDLLASGEYEGPVMLGTYLDLRQAMFELRRVREAQGLSLADLAERTGIDKGALSRLENGKNPNPTVDTLSRYAHAVGKRLTWKIED